MTTKAFVIGHPVAHSRSPLIFRHWFDAHGIDGDYQRIEVAPEDLSGFVAGLRGGAFAGGNVTVPHKQDVAGLCDELDPAARAIGAVNTLVVENGRIFGKNSDWFGVLANLDDRAPGWDSAPGAAIVLGAGGAARGGRLRSCPTRIFTDPHSQSYGTQGRDTCSVAGTVGGWCPSGPSPWRFCRSGTAGPACSQY